MASKILCGFTPLRATFSLRLCAFASKFLAFMLPILLLTSCFEPKQGCLDISAVNFDASADKDCEDEGCTCVYPKLQVVVDQRYDTLPYRRDSVYPSTAGPSFRLHEVVFYLSDFQIFRNGEVFTMSDTLGLRLFSQIGNDTLRQVFRNDFQLVRLETQTYAVGSFRESGLFSDVQIRLGLDAEPNRVIPALAPTGHPLSLQADSLWRNKAEGFVFLKVVVGRDVPSTTRDTLTFTRADIGDFFIQQSGVFGHTNGYDFRLRLKADYQKLLGDINWTVGDKTAWKQQIIANLPLTFSVSQ